MTLVPPLLSRVICISILILITFNFFEAGTMQAHSMSCHIVGVQSYWRIVTLVFDCLIQKVVSRRASPSILLLFWHR
ncbi:hypothetical protein V1522DRAFT_400601 [Lipomyces starkeyi]